MRAFLRPADAIGHDDAQRRVHARGLDRPHVDHVAEPALEAGLDGHLDRGGKLRAVRREDHLQQAAAEVRTVHALAGVGEEELLDHVADVIARRRWWRLRPRLSIWNGKSMYMLAAHSAVTRVWVTTMSTGVPVGAQIAWLLCTTSG